MTTLQKLLDSEDNRGIRILADGSICDCAAATNGPWADVHTKDCASLQFSEQRIARIIFEHMNNCSIRDPHSARAVIAILRPQR